MEISELDKWSNYLPSREIIEDFLDTLLVRGIELAKYSEEYENFMLPIMTRRDDLLDEYFGINRIQLEKERRELLEKCQSQQLTKSVGMENEN